MKHARLTDRELLSAVMDVDDVGVDPGADIHLLRELREVDREDIQYYRNSLRATRNSAIKGGFGAGFLIWGIAYIIYATVFKPGAFTIPVVAYIVGSYIVCTLGMILFNLKCWSSGGYYSRRLKYKESIMYLRRNKIIEEQWSALTKRDEA